MPRKEITVEKNHLAPTSNNVRKNLTSYTSSKEERYPKITPMSSSIEDKISEDLYSSVPDMASDEFRLNCSNKVAEAEKVGSRASGADRYMSVADIMINRYAGWGLLSAACRTLTTAASVIDESSSVDR